MQRLRRALPLSLMMLLGRRLTPGGAELQGPPDQMQQAAVLVRPLCQPVLLLHDHDHDLHNYHHCHFHHHFSDSTTVLFATITSSPSQLAFPCLHYDLLAPKHVTGQAAASQLTLSCSFVS